MKYIPLIKICKLNLNLRNPCREARKSSVKPKSGYLEFPVRLDWTSLSSTPPLNFSSLFLSFCYRWTLVTPSRMWWSGSSSGMSCNIGGTLSENSATQYCWTRGDQAETLPSAWLSWLTRAPLIRGTVLRHMQLCVWLSSIVRYYLKNWGDIS